MTGSNLRGPIYIDSSALVKLYLPEPESDRIEKALKGRRDLMVSDLAVTEIISAAARKKREGAISPDQISLLYRAILEDPRSEAFVRVDLLAEVHREAERLLLSLDSLPLRAADALHLALALSAGCATLLTFDARLAEAGKAAGLSTIS